VAKKGALKKLKAKRKKSKRRPLRKLAKAALVYRFWLPISVGLLLKKALR